MAKQQESSKTTQKQDFDCNSDKLVESFDEMNLREDLLRGIYSHGFEKPSPIQQRAIKPIENGCDTIAQAQSGTGKTATFAIASLQIVDLNERQCQILVLAPTRELANQIAKVYMAIGNKMSVKIHSCVGGTAVREDINLLNKGVQIVIGTPGRVNDMIRRGVLRLDKLQLFVLDEADEMLSKGFKEQIYDAFQYLPREVQVSLFSATMPKDIIDMSDKFMRNPVKILVKNELLTLDGIKQYYVSVGSQQFKFATLVDLYESLTIAQAIIYCNIRRQTKSHLNWDAYPIDKTQDSMHVDQKRMQYHML